jgi:outer membrane protein assembly factor BamB
MKGISGPRKPSKMFGGSSPLVVKNVVYQNTTEGMLALNAETGQLIWKQLPATCSARWSFMTISISAPGAR